MAKKIKSRRIGTPQERFSQIGLMGSELLRSRAEVEARQLPALARSGYLTIQKLQPYSSPEPKLSTVLTIKREPEQIKTNLKYSSFNEKKRKQLSRLKEQIQREEIETGRKERLADLGSELPYESYNARKRISQYLRQQNETAVRRVAEYPQWKQEQIEAADKQLRDRRIEKVTKGFEKGRKIVLDIPEKVTKAAGKAFKSASGAYGYRYKASKSLLSMASAFGTPVRGGQTGPGRPKMVYIHRSPFTGKPIPAPLWYKEMRQFKKLQQEKAEGVQTQRLRSYAQRGVPPQQVQYQQQVQQVQQSPQVQYPQRPVIRQLLPRRNLPTPRQQLVPQQQVAVTQLPPGTVIPRGTAVWKWRRGVVGEDWGLFGRQTKVYGLPESFFN